MTKEETAAWVEDPKNADEYVRGFDSLREGTRAYGCLVDLVQSGHVTAAELPEYGFPMPSDAAGDAPTLTPSK